MKQLLIALAVLLPAAVVFAQAKPAADPVKTLAELINSDDEQIAGATLLALRATEDKDLKVLLEALARSGDKQRRLFATASSGTLLKDGAKDLLGERLKSDPSMTIRAEALVALLGLKLATDEQLLDALRTDDESVQCIAARALAAKGKFDAARATLERLAKSTDLATKHMSQMSLLANGQSQHLPALRKVLADRNTSDELMVLLLEQAGEEKVAPARGALREALKTQSDPMVRVRIYRSLAAIDPSVCQEVVKLAAKSSDTIFCTYMIQLLGNQKDRDALLAQLAAAKNSAGVLARFELERLDKVKGTPAIEKALALKHPIVIDYVISALDRDVQAHGQAVDTAVPGLLAFIESVSTDVERMQPEHFRAAQAARVLTDLGTPRAIEGLSGILSGRYNAVVRAAAAGVSKSRNAQAACLLAKPLLKRPYQELSSGATLTLGRFGDKSAVKPLNALIQDARHQPPPLVALACWYSLKLQGQSKQAAAELAAKVK